MSGRGHKGNRDYNEKGILKDVVQPFGYVSFDDKKDSLLNSRGTYEKGTDGQGWDLLFLDEYGIFFVEIKNVRPDHPSDGDLTPAELAWQYICKAFGIPYYVVKNREEMADVLNGRRND